MRIARPLLLLLAIAAPVAYAATNGVVGELEQSSTSTPKEKLDFATKATEEIDSAVKTVEKLLEQAKKENDKEAIECLNRKLTPMRALREVATMTSNNMQQFLASNDTVHTEQEFRKIAVALTKTREFLAEAQQCVAASGGQPGKTASSVSSSTEDLIDVSDIGDDIDVVEVGSPN